MTDSARAAAVPTLPSGTSRRWLQPLARRQRLALLLWVILAIVAWNGLYDLLLARSTQNYLFRQMLHQAGMGQWIDLKNAMHVAVRDAVWVSTLWASVLLLAGTATVKFARP